MASIGSSSLTTETLIDARGLRCPLPVLKTEKVIPTLKPGATLTVLATDPVARIDIPLFCRQNGHECTLTQEGEVLRFTITKRA
jgi:tRNA 2-thiouridine synthesizing protein A